jgi:hypothetical protein
MFAVSFAIIVVLRPPLFAENVVSKSPCLRFEAFMFAVRYTYWLARQFVLPFIKMKLI